ncbi:hypothetical protein EVAR_88715_1 [Eumeta japonica]|uniref:Uncharacterized protein n=1 Tax=Eumeta variegata TaxID=151549 RepID=A0A4C1XFP1_EUMVA|nr:hypothetical protein EVAR_88715_1 [Eumeta japonica]
MIAFVSQSTQRLTDPDEVAAPAKYYGVVYSTFMFRILKRTFTGTYIGAPAQGGGARDEGRRPGGERARGRPANGAGDGAPHALSPVAVRNGIIRAAIPPVKS